MRPLSLTQRLFAVTALALLPALAIVVSNVVTLREAREREVHEEALHAAELASLEMERILSGTENLLRVLSAAPVVQGGDATACSAFVKRSVASLSYLASIAVIDPDGNVRCMPDPPPQGVYLGDRPYFTEAMETPARVTGVFTVGRLTDRKVLPVALRFASDSGAEVRGVIVAYVDLDWLQSRVRERGYAADSSLTIADRDGRILAREPEPERFVGTLIPAPFQRLVHAPARGTEEVTSQDGTRRIIGYVPASDAPEGLYVSAGVSTSSAFQPVTDVAVLGVVISLAGTLAAFLLARYTSRAFIAAPFDRLVGTVDAWRAGDTDVRTGLSPADGEIGRVGSGLDAFMEELLASRAARQQADDQRRLLSDELNHRVKNLLAMVQVVARQTFAGTGATSALATFEGRLRAMGEANTLLMLDRWQAAPVHDVVERCIAPFRSDRSSQFTLDGPAVSLPSGPALALSMALHELCTNAAKYGALSVETGRVVIMWSLSDDPAPDQFTLTWTERDGPAVEPPTRTGFGSTVIAQVLAQQIGGRVEVSYPPDGVICTIRATLASRDGTADPQAA